MMDPVTMEMKENLVLNSIEDAVEDIRNGKIVIVVDDENRENEGDFICAAECVTPEIINFMATHGRGLICTPIMPALAEYLQLDKMVANNTDLHGTAFTVSIDYKKEGCTTGISAYDRATGIKAMLKPDTNPSDFARPGHIFPLLAAEGGVLRRSGHTEAAIDLAQMAGYKPAGVLVEIMNEDGTMARLPQLIAIAKKFDLKIISIKDLIAKRMQTERLVQKEDSVEVKTPYGPFELIAFSERNQKLNHLAIVKGKWNEEDPVLVRVHSSTNTGDIFGSILDGWQQELSKTLKAISEEGKGVLLFLRHQDSENELLNVIKILKEQQKNNENLDPYPSHSSNSVQRNLGIGSQILFDLGCRKIKVLTKNPRKRAGVLGYGIEIVDQVAI